MREFLLVALLLLVFLTNLFVKRNMVRFIELTDFRSPVREFLLVALLLLLFSADRLSLAEQLSGLIWLDGKAFVTKAASEFSALEGRSRAVVISSVNRMIIGYCRQKYTLVLASRTSGSHLEKYKDTYHFH